jgi:hypothetical protein
MKKGLSLLIFVLCFVLSFSVAKGAELGVGAVADRLSLDKKRLVEGMSSPYAEITVVDPTNADKLVAVAEIEKHGRFKFEFGYPDFGLDRLVVFGADEFGLTSRVPMNDFLNSSVLMPPTIINDRADKGVKNLAIKGMTHPTAEVTVSLLRQGDSSFDIKVEAGDTGLWTLLKDDLKPGKYTATAVSNFGGKKSRPSQELYFEIALGEVPTGLNTFWQNLWSNLNLDPTWILILMMPFVWLHLRAWSGWGSLLSLLGLVWPLLGFKRRPKVGVVYDSVTKEPLENALVIAREYLSKKTVGIDVTNIRGEFNFALAPGEYVFGVRVGGYDFPSRLVKGKGDDGQYVNIYHGEKIILRQGDILSLSVPVDSLSMSNQSLFALKNFLRRFGGLISWVWLVLCIVWSVILYVYYPDLLHLLIMIYYSLLLCYLFVYIQPRKSGNSVVMTSGSSLVPEILVALYSWPNVELVATRVTDGEGRFAIHLDEGQYTVKLFDESYLLKSVNIASDGIITMKNKGWLKAKVFVDLK